MKTTPRCCRAVMLRSFANDAALSDCRSCPSAENDWDRGATNVFRVTSRPINSGSWYCPRGADRKARDVRTRALLTRTGVWLFERPDLRVQGIAHSFEPRTGQLGIVPRLFRSGCVGEYRINRSRVPQLRVIEHHRYSLIVAPSRYAGEKAGEFTQAFRILRRKRRLPASVGRIAVRYSRYQETRPQRYERTGSVGTGFDWRRHVYFAPSASCEAFSEALPFELCETAPSSFTLARIGPKGPSLCCAAGNPSA